ncbi:MAG: glycosyltransferase family 2 protein [Deltaproteobacteria bacterium]|nr:glycosyltransferase family 2 protein [Deltaproteobacteria bacterium]
MTAPPGTPAIGVAVITHAARRHLSRCLPPYLGSPLKPRVMVVNSSSDDGTVEEAARLGAETLVIPRREFNHGSTRELARKRLGTDIVVMTTPDAYPEDEETLGALVAPLIEGRAAVSYARQIAHEGADFFEAFPREFNYPAVSQLRGMDDAAKYGVYTFFCSDSCSAYVNAALDEIGGFRPVLTNEEAVVVPMLLGRGHKIAYVAEARVRHSHRYSLAKEFRRYFDTGLARRQCRDLLKEGGPDEKRGAGFVGAMLRDLLRTGRLHLVPYAVVQSGVKWLGYRTGVMSVGAPLWLKRSLSAQDFYWRSGPGR